MISVQNLKKNYGKYTAVDGISFELGDGVIFGLVGMNGAGKTTTLKMLAGLIKPDGGSIYIDGECMDENPTRLKSHIGYVPDFFGTYEKLKVKEYLEFYAGTYGIRSKEAELLGAELLLKVGLKGMGESFVDSLSRGMKQRLCVARALIHDPGLLILDEPTSGMDPASRKIFCELLYTLKREGKTIIISSHLLPELSELCTHVGILDQGKIIISGSMKEIEEKWETEKQLIIRITGGISEAMEVLKESDLVRSLSILDDKIMISFTGNSEEECDLLKRLIFSGARVRSFSREQSSLENIFMKLT